MREKLKSVFLAPQSILFLKSALFGLSLVFLKSQNFNWLLFLAFLAVFGILFVKSRSMPLAILFASALGTVWALDNFLFIVLTSIFLSILLYLEAGVNDLVIVHRFEWGFIKTLLLLFAIFLLFFVSDKSSYFALKYFLIFIAAFFIFQEWFSQSDIYFPKRHFLTSLIIAFLSVQLLWGIALLPIGALNSASLAVLMAYIFIDFANHYFQGTVSKKVIWKNAAIFALLCLAVFITSFWKI